MFLDLDELNLLREAPEDELEVDELDTSTETEEETSKDDSTDETDTSSEEEVSEEDTPEETSEEDPENDTSLDNGDEFATQTEENEEDENLEDPDKVDTTGFNTDEIKLSELYEKFIATKNILEQLKETLADLNYHKNNKLFDRIQNNLDKLVRANKRILTSSFTVENYESYLSSYYFIHGNLQTINDIFTVITDSEKSSDAK